MRMTCLEFINPQSKIIKPSIDFQLGTARRPQQAAATILKFLVDMGAFPKLGVPLGVPITRSIVFGGLYWGPLI